ncbi:MAG TPA: MATE family efflux transporter [Methanocorpusculum sp.]|nr:MATE family efflux transporter [Methanocorpusculum sp.]
MPSQTTKQGAAGANFLTDGPVLKALFIIALPIILSNLLQSVLDLVDMYFIGKLGDNSIAAGSVSMSVMMVLLTIVFGLNTAGAAFISRAFGSEKHDRIPVILAHVLYIGLGLGLVIAFIGAFFTESLLTLMGAEPEVISEGVKFLQPYLIGSLILIILMILCTILQSTGDSKTPMFVMIIVNVVNIALNPTLIQGLWIFPEMGIAGSAFASLISRSVGIVLLILAMYYLPSRRDSPIKFPKKWTFEPHLIKDIIFVAIPSAVQSAIRSFSMLGMNWIVIMYGTAALAAYGICGRLDMLGFILVMGLCTGVAVMVGQNLGAQKPERAEKAAKYGILINGGFMLVVAVLYLLFASHLVEFFGATDTSLEIGISFMQICPLGYFIAAMGMTMGFAMNGAGMTRPGMYAALLGQLGTQLGCAMLFKLVFDLPIQSIWIAIIIGGCMTCLVDFIFFRHGGWKRNKLNLDARK